MTIKGKDGGVTSRVGVVPLGYMAAVIATTIAGTIVQTQFNLMALKVLGTDIPVSLWLWTTLQDLGGFSPLFFMLVAVSYLLALPAGAAVARLIGQRRTLICMLAATLGLLVAFRLADALAPMPTLIAATRTMPGLLAMLATAALGGWLFAVMTPPTSTKDGAS